MDKDRLTLSRWFILKKVLYKLNFDLPHYASESWDDGLFRCQIKFGTPTGPDEETPDNTYEIWSGWFPHTEEAREHAAHCALDRLQNIAVFHIEDYSMSTAWQSMNSSIDNTNLIVFVLYDHK